MALILDLSVLLCLASATKVAATTVWYPREQMLSYIEWDYQASQAANGVVRPYSVMGVWVSDDDGDWLVVTTDKDGNSCIVTYGEDFISGLPAPVEQS